MTGQLARRTARRNRIYNELRAQFLAANPYCEVRWGRGICTGQATEIEHRLRASHCTYDQYLDPNLWAASCHGCAVHTTTNPALAKARGVQLCEWDVSPTPVWQQPETLQVGGPEPCPVGPV